MLKLTMIKILKKQGWLVVAAALIIVLSACTKEDMVNGAQAQTDAAQIINVTVGAGFDTNASTRSAVVYNESDKTSLQELLVRNSRMVIIVIINIRLLVS